MFYGQYSLTLDQKGRLALPRQIRDGIAENSVVVRIGFEQTLYIYDKPFWEIQAQQYLAEPIESQSGRQKRRDVFGSSQVLKVDEQGRITIPQRFLAYAGITDQALGLVLLGAGDHFEIWSGQIWEVMTNEQY